MADLRAAMSLILLAQAGDRRALEELFRTIQAPLHGYLARLLGNAHLAEDVLQDVFVLIWRKLPWLRDPALFRPWAYQIASREGMRRLQKERSWFRLLGSSDLESIAAETPAGPELPEWIDQLKEHLSALSPASRAVVVLHYLHSLTLDEVAAALEVPSGTVKSRLAYGLAVLRRELSEQGTSDERRQTHG